MERTARLASTAVVIAAVTLGCRDEPPCFRDSGSFCQPKEELVAELEDAGIYDGGQANGGPDAATGCPSDCDVARLKELVNDATVIGFDKPGVDNGTKCCYFPQVITCHGWASQSDREQAKAELGAHSPCR
jgi:hypothetical protein